jgi:DNA primase
VDALIPLDELENWASRNIYPPNYGDKVADQIKEMYCCINTDILII